MAAWLALGGGFAAWSQAPAIPWRSGIAPLVAQTKAVPAGGLAVLQFHTHPTDAQRAVLERDGVTLLTYVGAGAWFARVQGNKTLGAEPGLAAAGPADPLWKVEPSLWAGDPPPHALLGGANAKSAEARVAVLLLVLPDVDLLTEGADAVTRHGGVVHSAAPAARTLLCDIPLANAAALAAEPSVQWIEPAAPPFTAVNDSSRSRIQAGPLQQAPYNLSGAGVKVMVFDTGLVNPGHPDFAGRLGIGDPDRDVGQHPSHVAGTIAGSGVESVHFGGGFQQWRGMAPAAHLISYEYEALGIGEIFFADPGDIEGDYLHAVANGAVIANNSVGSNVGRNGYRCQILGDYCVTSALVDGVVRGSAGAPLIVVWAAGNERAQSACGTEHHTLAPPAGVKNPIVVGAVNSDTDEVSSFSSWGPTDDGRLKPDVTAPGSQASVDRGVTSVHYTGGYSVMQGTSMAAPAVSGVAALLVEEYRRRNPQAADPANSLVKALLIHGAHDNGNMGPDYRYGYGSVRAQRSVDIMRTGVFAEGLMADRSGALYTVAVAPGASELKATLAWDDAPAAPNAGVALVNDLDILAISPSGAVHFPATLNPGLPELPAARNQFDRRNNVEQIYTVNPEPGEWTLWVRGYSIPVGPQPYSLVATPALATCGTAAQLRFVSQSVSCEGRIALVLADCNADLDSAVIDSAAVSVSSPADADGFEVSLVETAPSSGVFVGELAVSESGTPGALLVYAGGVATAAYAPAAGDPVVAAVTVDCAPPTFSGVAIVPTAQTARFNFSTNKPARIAIHYGLACGALTEAASDGQFVLNHTIVLPGLLPETAYFAVITAEDLAGNVATSDRNGLCHTFTTQPAREHFTQLLVPGAWDLDFSALVFKPAAGDDGYTANRYRNVFFLPDNPAEGAPIPLADDGSALVSLTGGKRVPFHGTSYGALFVGSNGYVTFTKGDDTQIPTFPGHFSLPRVAALFQDLDPSGAAGSGPVTWKQYEDRVSVTWAGVPRWDQPAVKTTMQVRLFFDGAVEIIWLATGGMGGIAGLSKGGGMPSEIVQSDLSAYPPGLLRMSAPSKLTVAAHTGVLDALLGADGFGGPITFTAPSLPPGATLAPGIDGTAALQWRPHVGLSGMYAATITARQGGNDVSRTIPIEVTPYTHLPPEALTPRISPVQPYLSDPLEATYAYNDPDGFPESGRQILWSRNGVVQAEWNDRVVLPAEATRAGDQWTFQVRVSDGYLFGAFAQSPAVLVRHPYDMTGDGVVRAEDVQALINAVLTGEPIPGAATGDLNGDGERNAIDIQLAILAALGVK